MFFYMQYDKEEDYERDHLAHDPTENGSYRTQGTLRAHIITNSVFPLA